MFPKTEWDLRWSILGKQSRFATSKRLCRFLPPQSQTCPPAEAALAQIEKKGYAKRFDASEKKIFRIAIVFSTEKGGVAGYSVVE